ncbi:hypothetical protein C2E23DRAFT_887033 [Lenzites betulinus]|nr:hypothetical protein C2E23DRAFT_887033 [Lenzites betulinus]
MANLYLRVGPGARDVNSMRAPYIPAIVIVLDGPEACLNILIPTCDHELLDPEYFAHWVTTIQGPIPTDCEATDDQRDLLLSIALACHGFLSGWPGVDADDWPAFIGRLTEAALSLARDERADDHLEEIVEWLKHGLPLDLFEGPHVPPVSQARFNTPLVAQMGSVNNQPPLHWLAPGAIGRSPAMEPTSDSDADVLTDDDMPPLLDNDDVSTGSVFEGIWRAGSS